jgi:hypothetical protein
MISTIVNSISSSILKYGVCNLWISPWSNPRPKCSFDGIATRDHSAIFGYHHGAIPVQSVALMELQQGFQVAYLITIRSNQFS